MPRLIIVADQSGHQQVVLEQPIAAGVDLERPTEEAVDLMGKLHEGIVKARRREAIERREPRRLLSIIPVRGYLDTRGD